MPFSFANVPGCFLRTCCSWFVFNRALVGWFWLFFYSALKSWHKILIHWSHWEFFYIWAPGFHHCDCSCPMQVYYPNLFHQIAVLGQLPPIRCTTDNWRKLLLFTDGGAVLYWGRQNETHSGRGSQIPSAHHFLLGGNLRGGFPRPQASERSFLCLSNLSLLVAHSSWLWAVCRKSV